MLIGKSRWPADRNFTRLFICMSYNLCFSFDVIENVLMDSLFLLSWPMCSSQVVRFVYRVYHVHSFWSLSSNCLSTIQILNNVNFLHADGLANLFSASMRLPMERTNFCYTMKFLYLPQEKCRNGCCVPWTLEIIQFWFLSIYCLYCIYIIFSYAISFDRQRLVY